LDGIPYWLIENMILNGELRNIKYLATNGVYGVLEALSPIFTPPNWTSAFTGVEPREHGIFSFNYINRNYKLSSINSKFRKTDPVWIIASRKGKRSIVVNVPLTYPPDKLNGVMVSGDERIGKPTKKHVYPLEAYELIEEVGYEFEAPSYDNPEEIFV